MKVVMISEDNHGMIGLATTYEKAVEFLVKDNWLDGNYIVEEETDTTIAELLGENWLLTVQCRDLEWFNEFFEDVFYLDLVEVFE